MPVANHFGWFVTALQDASDHGSATFSASSNVFGCQHDRGRSDLQVLTQVWRKTCDELGVRRGHAMYEVDEARFACFSCFVEGRLGSHVGRCH